MSVNSHSIAFLKRPDINAAADALVRKALEEGGEENEDQGEGYSE